MFRVNLCPERRISLDSNDDSSYNLQYPRLGKIVTVRQGTDLNVSVVV